MIQHPDLSAFDNCWYSPGRSAIVRALWFFFGLPVLRSWLIPSSVLRRCLLRLFGAGIGSAVVIKPGVRVKYPWRLTVGERAWIGEDAWIDNLGDVTIGANACVSQGAYLCTGNHDYKDPRFGLVIRGISVGDGAWVGAKVVVCPGVKLGEGAVAAAGSVVAQDVPAWEIHGGNPARFVRRREMREADPG